MEYNSIEERIVQEIKDKILSGELAENTRISEREICDAYHVTRPAVRIAIDRLKKENWLFVKAKSGTYVAPINKKTIEESFQVRLMIEPQILIWNINEIDSADVERMRHNTERMRVAEHEEYAYRELDNHTVIKEKTKNTIIVELLDNMIANILRITSKTSVSEERRLSSIYEWERIIACIERKEAHQASQYMTLHLLNTADEFWRNYRGDNQED
ncbi:MAG: GntR family transcriptional regulator [Coprococcus sp.]|nr:GntR family transcriptional regulator [Coprococcus sp.]